MFLAWFQFSVCLKMSSLKRRGSLVTAFPCCPWRIRGQTTGPGPRGGVPSGAAGKRRPCLGIEGRHWQRRRGGRPFRRGPMRRRVRGHRSRFAQRYPEDCRVRRRSWGVRHVAGRTKRGRALPHVVGLSCLRISARSRYYLIAGLKFAPRN